MPDQPVDVGSLKPEDVVVTSTPQQRREEKPEPPAPPETPKPDETIPPVTPPEDPKPKDEENPDPNAPEEGDEESGEEIEDEFDWEALSNEVGIELDSDDAVVESLRELATYKSLSPALQKAIEIERNKGDVAAYFKSIANDPKDLSDRDALWEQYVAENPKRVAGNPKFARLDFDRKVDKEYALLTEYEKLSASDREDFLEEHKDEIDYLTEKRKFDAEAARASLQEKRAGATFNTPDKPDPKAVEERMAEVMRNHESGYKKALSEFDVVALNVGNDFEFNVGLTESNKKVATEWMKNPESFLKELGFTKESIDYDTLAGWAALIADIKYGTFGERLRQALIDNKDIKTLENTLDAPGIVKTGGEKPILQGDEWDQLGDAFEKKRMESKKKR